MKKKISAKDLEDWNKFINSTEKVYQKDKNQNPNNQTSHRIVDLHGFSLDEANSKINELISICYEKGIKTLKIITGKGKRSNKTLDPYVSKDLSILKNSVPEYIRSNNDLMNMIKEIKNYNDIKGNSGYFEIILKKKL